MNIIFKVILNLCFFIKFYSFCSINSNSLANSNFSRKSSWSLFSLFSFFSFWSFYTLFSLKSHRTYWSLRTLYSIHTSWNFKIQDNIFICSSINNLCVHFWVNCFYFPYFNCSWSIFTLWSSRTSRTLNIAKFYIFITFFYFFSSTFIIIITIAIIHVHFPFQLNIMYFYVIKV